jgi:hypothetical protein
MPSVAQCSPAFFVIVRTAPLAARGLEFFCRATVVDVLAN